MARSAFLWFFTESWGSKQGIRRSPKSCTRKEHESATNPIAKRGQGGTSSLFVCPLRSPEAAPLVGLGATPQLFHGRPVMPNALNPAALVAGSAASLRSNFARPQTRPQAALSTYSTLSRQMGATDQHREKSFSLGAGLFRYLRARLRTRKVTGRDASLPAPC